MKAPGFIITSGSAVPSGNSGTGKGRMVRNGIVGTEYRVLSSFGEAALPQWRKEWKA
jgi:hypothetical protein